MISSVLISCFQVKGNKFFNAWLLASSIKGENRDFRIYLISLSYRLPEELLAPAFSLSKSGKEKGEESGGGG